ncbi:hypothetical protein O181_025163 [Austropuccinia psidii MF-1]|uniref:Uncharacterized protein n=1 Tax=Austropuccinia psidii MF-1 TaxID=1389203 RepID=A0A9Q3CK76_9BASI|nr:hypothetical protein [Austropuccinia psidii MF-1]
MRKSKTTGNIDEKFDPFLPSLHKADLLDYLYRNDPHIVIPNKVKVQELREMANNMQKRHNNFVSPRHSRSTNHSQGKSTATTRGQSPAVTSGGQSPAPAIPTRGQSAATSQSQSWAAKTTRGKPAATSKAATQSQSPESNQPQSDKTSARGCPQSSSTVYPTKRKMGSCPHEEDIVEEPKSSKKKSKATSTTTKKAVPRGHSQASSKANSTSHGTFSQEATQVPSSSLKRTKLHPLNVKKQISPKKKQRPSPLKNVKPSQSSTCRVNHHPARTFQMTLRISPLH